MPFPLSYTAGFACSCFVNTLAVCPFPVISPPSSAGPKGCSILLSLQAQPQGLDSAGRGPGEPQVPDGARWEATGVGSLENRNAAALSCG